MSENTPILLAQVQDMVTTINLALVDAEKFGKGNDSAGTRLRKAMQQLKAQAQQVRQQVSEIKAAKP